MVLPVFCIPATIQLFSFDLSIFVIYKWMSAKLQKKYTLSFQCSNFLINYGPLLLSKSLNHVYSLGEYTYMDPLIIIQFHLSS